MNPLTKEEFLEKLKTDRQFNNKYGRKHITEGKQVLPPCHYGFQVYTRELSLEERAKIWNKTHNPVGNIYTHNQYNENEIPSRAISLMFNMRSNDVLLGLPFNIASYGLLLEIIGNMVNMVPDELIGNLGDTHLYLNHIEQAKEQIGRELTLEERIKLAMESYVDGNEMDFDIQISSSPTEEETHDALNIYNVPKRTREPFALPTLAHMKTDAFYQSLSEDLSQFSHLDPSDFKIENYKSHPKIEAPLSN